MKQPLQRRERPRVPDDLRPESYEHCAQLLEMIHDLLATNREQLRHQGRISGEHGQRPGEQRVTEDGEDAYEPDEHLVDETVDVAAPTSGVDLYADFYDRLTYEALLRAALAAVYHPQPESGALPAGADFPGGGPVVFPAPPTMEDEVLREQLLTRIARGFRQLVGRFLQGLADPEYLREAPAQYLLELFVIISAYLRVVWRDGMLAHEQFIDHSVELLFALWGHPGHEGAWGQLA